MSSRIGAASLLLALGCGASPADPASTAPGSSAADGGTGDGGGETGGPGAPAFAAECADAPWLGGAVVEGTVTLGSTSPDALGCGEPARTVFARFAPEARADVIVHGAGAEFDPRLAVLPASCDPGTALACAVAVPIVVPDVAPGTELVIAVGVDAGDPALEVGGDALAFRLRVELRPVYGAGQICAGEGRCETGSACLDDAEGVPRCTVLDADTCATAELVVLDPGVGAMAERTIPAEAMHTDAHQHSCAGAHTAERAFRIALSGPLPDSRRVEIASPTTGVTLAARDSGCVTELACATASGAAPDPVRLDASAFFDPAQPLTPAPVHVFVERPASVAGAPSEPVIVSFRVVDA